MENVMKYITKIFRLSQQYKEEMAKNMEISGNESQHLICVCHHKGITQDQIAKKLCVDKSNVTRRLSSLEEKGYITRVALPMDKRNLQVFPTEKSMEILKEVENAAQSWNTYILAGLTEEEREQLDSILKKIRDRAVEWQEAGYPHSKEIDCEEEAN